MAMAQTAKKINIAAYFPAFGAIRTGGNAGQNKQDVAAGSSSFNDLLHLMQKGVGPGITSNSPFSFCKDDTNGCVIFAMNTYDTFDQRINKDFYDLTNGNCFDSFSISDGSWFNDTGAYNVPPQQLVRHIFLINNYHQYMFSGN
jgi:hypothetical protein